MSMKYFFIAGEPSGDALGGPLIKALKEKQPDAKITGVGGLQMQAQGLESLLPMEELCVIGLWEVISQLSRLMRLINAMSEEIIEQQPDVVITIDLPDFNFRVAEKLKRAGFKGKIIHYVAPSVWAWRPGRAKKVSKFLDGIMCLFPFEPEHFEAHGLRSKYVGHPLIEVKHETLNPDLFKEKYGLRKDAKKIGVFFGSRPHEFNKIGPIIVESIRMLHEQDDNFILIAPTLPSLEMEITNLANELPCKTYVLTDQKEKWDAFASCDMAIAVSGTVGLELAYIGIPHLIAYQVHPLTYLIIRFLVKIKYAHLGNILLEDKVVDEFLQGDCTPFNLAKTLYKWLKHPEMLEEKQEDLKRVREVLRADDNDFVPSHEAAQFIIDLANNKVKKPKPPASKPKPEKKKVEKKKGKGLKKGSNESSEMDSPDISDKEETNKTEQ